MKESSQWTVASWQQERAIVAGQLGTDDCRLTTDSWQLRTDNWQDLAWIFRENLQNV